MRLIHRARILLNFSSPTVRHNPVPGTPSHEHVDAPEMAQRQCLTRLDCLPAPVSSHRSAFGLKKCPASEIQSLQVERELQHHKADGRGPNCHVYDIALNRTPLGLRLAPPPRNPALSCQDPKAAKSRHTTKSQPVSARCPRSGVRVIAPPIQGCAR
jgi:hypothetical protein